MNRSKRLLKSALVLITAIALFVSAEAQKKPTAADNGARPVMWERVNVRQQDLYMGPGGREMLPDLSRITFLKEETGGFSKKFRLKDGSDRTWVAKIGLEAQSETAAVRLLSAIGYKTEINYLVPKLTIPGKGTFSNVRLEARPDNVDRGKEWRWGHSPFEGTKQMRGLMIMMAFLNNWDMKSANNVILKTPTERQYVISDLGVSFGKTGSNGLPLFWRIGRSRNNPDDYAAAKFVKGVEKNRVKLVFNGKNRSRMKNFTTADARWLSELLNQLSASQIMDAFRAANYSRSNIDKLTRAVRNRITDLDRAAATRRGIR